MQTLRKRDRTAVKIVTPSGVVAVVAVNTPPDLLAALRRKRERKLRRSGHLQPALPRPRYSHPRLSACAKSNQPHRIDADQPRISRSQAALRASRGSSACTVAPPRRISTQTRLGSCTGADDKVGGTSCGMDN